MIVGSGLIAKALDDKFGVVQYAAGVSNSSCTDKEEFDRDIERLKSHLLYPGLFVYFSTCSKTDNDYVHHKMDCEQMVMERGDYLICRLPSVAGRSSNPHTLLNYISSRVQRSEKFDLQVNARRNIIDIVDMSTIVRWLLKTGAMNETINIAAPMYYSMKEIVAAFEQLYEKLAVVKETTGIETKRINTSRIKNAPVDWSGDYLSEVIRRHYR